MLRFIGRRLLAVIPVVLVVTFLVFALIELAPGDAADSLAGENPTPERVEAIRTELRLDEPFLQRYFEWLGGAIHGDFGNSYFSKQPVMEMIKDRIPVTLSLGMISLVLSLGIGFLLGVGGAIRPRGLLDRAVTGLSSVMLAV